MRSIGAVIIAAIISSACAEGFGPSVTSLREAVPTASSAFLKSYEENLVWQGLSAKDAAFIASKATLGMKDISSKPKASAKVSDDWGAIGEATMKRSLAALASSDHFGTAESKKLALSAVTVSHFTAISAQVSASALLGIEGRIAEVAANELDETGLSGADLTDAMKRQSEALMTTMIGSQIPPEFHANLIKSMTTGTVRGLGSNPALSNSSASLVAAIASGTSRAVGSDNGLLSDDIKGLIVREMLLAVKSGLDDVPSFAQSEKGDFFSDVAAAAQTTLASIAPTLVTNVTVVAIVVGKDLPDVVLPPVSNPTPTPAPTATPAPTPTPTPDPSATPAPTSSGSPVVSTPLSCQAQIGSGATQRPKWNVTSNAQCESYCDGIANNYSSSSVSCRVAGIEIQSYLAPRTPVYTNANDPISCVARITTTEGATDYKPPTVVKKTDCISFCDTVIPRGGLKVCYGDGVSIKEYWGKGLE